MSEASDTVSPAKPGFVQILRSMGQVKTGYMTIFGFASGLPYALFLGTLYAWLSEAEVNLETMGVFSLIGLAYAFQFIWSPLVDKLNIPGFAMLGKRKQWIVPMQLILGIILVTLSVLEPRTQLGWFSLLAGIGALASATQDIAINAWRIDVADETATLDILSAVYQMGYRLAALVGGAFGLIIAASIGWPETYMVMGAILLAIGFLGLFAPDADSAHSVDAVTGLATDDLAELYAPGEIRSDARNKYLSWVLALWGWTLLILGIFMVRVLGGFVPMFLPVMEFPFYFDFNWLLGMFPLEESGRPNPTQFTRNMGPIIILATVVLPSLIAAVLDQRKNDPALVIREDETVVRSSPVYDHLYRALLVPLIEFVGRMGWSLVLIFSLVLTYRICDAIWGSFAYPFYLGELNYTNEDVAFASKMFGVFAIIAGLAIGGIMLSLLGRMLTLTIGALLAALTNLLYAELAMGGELMQAASDAIGFTALIDLLTGLFSFLFVTAPPSEGIAKLAFTIMFENLAVGIAGAAFVAYLSSIVNKKFSAVQYALLSSLTMLVGTLGRGALGEMIEDQGYVDVFVLTTIIGLVAVVLVAFEWIRQVRMGEASGVVAPEAQPAR